MSRTSVESDEFNRANESPVSDGGKWSTNTLPSTGGGCDLVSNQVQAGSTGGNLKLMERTSAVVTDDQYARIIVTAIPVDGGSSGSVGAYVRGAGLTPGINDFYLGHARALTPFTRIMRCDDGSFTVIATTDDVDKRFAATDEMIIEAEGTTIRLLRNGVEVLSVTDATYTSGKTGICAHSPTASSIGILDSYDGGNVTSAPPIITPGDLRYGGVRRSSWLKRIRKDLLANPGSTAAQVAGRVGGTTRLTQFFLWHLTLGIAPLVEASGSGLDDAATTYEWIGR